jgi:hypothetical protein
MSLLTMGPLCDAGCTIEFTATTMEIQLCDNLVLQGNGTPPSLWIFQLPTNNLPVLPDENSMLPQMNSANGAPKAAELVVYSHATLFSPAISTLEQALKRGYIQNFPGLTTKTLQHHLPHSIATAKGHLDQVRQNLRSTRVKLTDLPPTTTDDTFPLQETPTLKCYVMSAPMPTAPTGKYYTNQTGCFSCTPSSGNNYVLFANLYNCNCILAEPLPNCKANSIVVAHKRNIK